LEGDTKKAQNRITMWAGLEWFPDSVEMGWRELK
jgi:hypothetical protein